MDHAAMFAQVRQLENMKFFLNTIEDFNSTKKIKAQFEYFNKVPLGGYPPNFRPDVCRESVRQQRFPKPVEQLLLSASKAEGAKVLDLIKEAIEIPGVYVFGELLAMPKIGALRVSPDSIYWHTLVLFAYGTYKQYLAKKQEYLPLTLMQEKKLKLLTIVTLAAKTTSIPYAVLKEELSIKTTHDLENFIIEALHADVIEGKIDQKDSQLIIVATRTGRDATPADIGATSEKLSEWTQNCESLLNCIEDQIHVSEEERQEFVERKQELQEDIEFVRKYVRPEPE